jgi:hypothetical protein
VHFAGVENGRVNVGKIVYGWHDGVDRMIPILFD